MKDNKLLIGAVITMVVVFIIAVFTMLGLVITKQINIFNGTSGNNTEIRDDKSKNPDNSNYITDIYEANNDAVISVVNLKEIAMRDFFSGKVSKQQIEQGSGSGFVYKEENGYYYAITNYHVVEGSDQIQVVLSSEEGQDPEVVDAIVIGGSKKDDLVVLKFKTSKDITPVKIGNSDSIVPGEGVVAMGSPYGVDFQGSVTDGIVSAPKRKMIDADGNESYYVQTDAAINSGNSGGPLFNVDGEVIGVNSMKIADGTTDNMAFAIPINHVMEIVAQIEALEDK